MHSKYTVYINNPMVKGFEEQRQPKVHVKQKAPSHMTQKIKVQKLIK